MKKKICIAAAVLSALPLFVIAGIKLKRRCANKKVQGDLW